MSADTPDLIDTLEAWFAAHASDTHTAGPGRVESYNASTRTANVKPLWKHALEDDDGSVVSEEYPVVPNAPILFPGSGPYRITFPVSPGDLVLLVACESSIGHIRASGELSEPGDLRRHSLSHAVALPGFFSSRNVQAAATDAIVIGQDGLTPQYVALANKVDAALGAIKDTFDQHTHTGGTISGSTGIPVPTIGILDPTAAAKVKAT
jgi:hypothetical protein